MQRINESLIDRGYLTWFDLTNMKGEQHCCSSLLSRCSLSLSVLCSLFSVICMHLCGLARSLIALADILPLSCASLRVRVNNGRHERGD
eukprot:COSAG06_NODE_42668_length_379_cov_1.239286_1_plen_88_part_01